MGDYASKTADLSLAEHGAYNVLLDTQYSTERALPGPYDALYRLCRAMSKEEQAAVRLVADRFFPLGSDDLRRNPRAWDEIAKAQATINKQRKSGADSAAKRWSTDGSTDFVEDGLTDGSTHRSTDPEAIQPPTTNLQPRATNHQKTPSATDVAFERFWKAYPRKVAKPAALKAWGKAKPDDLLTERIIRAVQAQSTCEQWTKDGGAFIPHPATWLNNRRWEDDLGAPGARGESGGPDFALAVG